MIKVKHTIMALIPTVAMAASPVSSPVVGETGFTTLDSAATQALQTAEKASRSVEEAGALYVLNGKYFYTSPATNADYDKFAIQIQFPVGAKLVGLYHTHPDYNYDNDMFSPEDVQIAKQMHVTSYIGVLGANHIRKFIPGVSTMTNCDECGADPMDYFHNVSRGTVIGVL